MQIIRQDDKIYIASMDVNATVINLFDLEDSTANIVVSLDSIAQNFHIFERYFLAHSIDSIFVFADEKAIESPECKQVFLINKQGDIIKHWNINEILQSESERQSIPFKSSAILFDKTKLYFHTISKKAGLFTISSREKAYSDPSELVLDISKEPAFVSRKMGYFPKEYIQHNFYDPFPSRCINDKGQLIYSYGADHNLYVYENDRFLKKVKANSDYIDQFVPFDDDNKMDNYFIRKYLEEEPRYTNIIYDPYRKFYYRLVDHRLELEKEDGTLRTSKDRKSSIIVLDNKLNKITEVVLEKYGGIYGILPEGVVLAVSMKGVAIVNFEFQ